MSLHQRELAPYAHQRLIELTRRARLELELTAHPTLDWMPPSSAPDGGEALDVLIVGGGQGGAALAMQLKRDRITRVKVVDRSSAGQEGPWRSYARMHTLRSPKDYTGPDLGIPSLTYRAWHEARYGEAHWDALRLIDKDDWVDYLLWVRETSQVEVQNNTEVTAIEPVAGFREDEPTLFKARLTDSSGAYVVYARKVVLASGQDGAGRWKMPGFVEALPSQFRCHAAHDIDFAALEGKTVAVLGAGASAADNAAMALEHGAGAVHMFVRRDKMQRVQPYRWLTFKGFLRHLCDLDDEWRWRFMQRVLAMRESIPQDTYNRMRKHSNFHIHVNRGWRDAQARVSADGPLPVRIETAGGEFLCDYVIAGTGIDIDFARKPELAVFAEHIQTWADAYAPPPEERDPRLGRYPYLDAYGAYTEKTPGSAPFLAGIFDFTIAATMSFGPSGSSINAMTTAVPRLAAGVSRSLFREDAERHWKGFLAYDVPVFEPDAQDRDK